MVIAAVLALAFGAPLLFAQKPLNPKVAALIPEQPTGYLTDMAGVVKNPDQVNSRLSFIRDSLKLSLVAVVLPTIGDLQPDEVALDIGRRWKVATANDTIGNAVRNTGGVILIVMDSRKCRIEVATGSEGYLTDSRAGTLCRDARDDFRAGNMGDGIIEMADGFAKFHTASLEVEQAVRPTTIQAAPEDDSNTIMIFFLLLLAVAGVGIALYIRGERIERERQAERDALWREYEAQQRVLREKRQKEEAERRERERLEQERIWNAMTPEQQQAELALRRKRELEAAEKRQREAEQRRKREAEEAERRRQRDREDEEDRRRRSTYDSIIIADFGSSSSSSSSDSDSGGYSSGGSDSFSGGGGGSDW